MRMMEGDDWSIVFYTRPSRESPIADFLASLDQRTRVRFGWSIEQLRVRNINAREPLVKHLEGKLWELRESSGTNIYGLLYFFFAGRQIIFVHWFQKKSEKTRRRELDTAVGRMEDFLSQRGGE